VAKADVDLHFHRDVPLCSDEGRSKNGSDAQAPAST